MKHGHLYFEIQADDTARAVNFYSNVFGWEFSEVKGLPIPYWSIETGGARGGLLKRPAEKPPTQCGTNAFVCSMEIENFAEIEEKILSLGGIVALEKFLVPGKCWQGYFIDTEGNTFGVFEVLKNIDDKDAALYVFEKAG
ncbi:MAG: VOC family protein [Pseudomonadota bacterium]